MPQDSSIPQSERLLNGLDGDSPDVPFSTVGEASCALAMTDLMHAHDCWAAGSDHVCPTGVAEYVPTDSRKSFPVAQERVEADHTWNEIINICTRWDARFNCL